MNTVQFYSDQRHFAHVTAAAVGDLRFFQQEDSPRQVAEVRIYGAADDLAPDLAKLLRPVAEGDNLGGANEGEVQRVEKENHILP